MATTHIIGAGLAGLSAAVTLARAGHFVQLYESSGAAGGRVRLLYDTGDNQGYDGCNALLFDAYRVVKAFATSLGSAHSLIAHDAAGLHYDIARKAFTKRSAFLLPPCASLLELAQWLRLVLARGTYSVDSVMNYYHPLRESYLEPICRSLMYQECDVARAGELAPKLRYVLSGGRKGARLLIPKQSLYHTLVAPALTQIESEGGTVYFGQSLKHIEWQGTRACELVFAKQKKIVQSHDSVLLALPHLAILGLNVHCALPKVLYNDIVSVYFDVVHEGVPRMIPITGGTVDWLKLQGNKAVAVCYAPARLMALDNEAIARKQWQQIASIMGMDKTQMPQARVTRDRKAVACAADSTTPQIGNLLIAGEVFGATHLPPIEAAISSGIAAAQMILHKKAA